jgi:hypothetical protein
MALVAIVDAVLASLKEQTQPQPQTQGGDYDEGASLSLAVLQLKVLGRQSMLSLDAREGGVAQHKERNDAHRLRLENLLYRKAYLAREIQACKDFTPAETHRVEGETGQGLLHSRYSADLPGRHRQSLASLAGEFQSRQRMQELLAKLKEQFQEETGALDKKMRFLEELPGRLDAVLASTGALQAVAAPGEGPERDARLRAAARLPAPLYTLFRSLLGVESVLAGGGGAAPAPAPGYSVLLSRPAGPHCAYGTRWVYRVEVVEPQPAAAAAGAEAGAGAQPPSYLELHMRIEVDAPLLAGGSGSGGGSGGGGERQAAPETAAMTLRFSTHSPSDTGGGGGGQRLVGVAVSSLSFQSKCPFRADGLLHALYPHDEGESNTATTPTAPAAAAAAGGGGGACYLWAQWLCGLRPVPRRADAGGGDSAAAVLHRVSC